MTSPNAAEIRACPGTFQKTPPRTGFMHAAFHLNVPNHFPRPWLAWANTLSG